MKIDNIVKSLCTLGRRSTDPDMALGAVLYYGAILISRYDIKKDVSNLNDFINIYILMFGKSGVGKTYVINQVEKLCSLENYPEQRKIMYEHFIDLEPDGEKDPEVLRFLPSSTTTSLDGSKEGLFQICNAVKKSGFASLNLFADEFGDTITGSQELINKLKELYDGKYQAKVVKGAKGDSTETDIDRLTVNMIAVGSLDGLDAESQKVLNTLAKSGLYRRSLIINSEMEAQKNNEQDANLDEIRNHFKHIDNKWKESYKKRLDEYTRVGHTSYIFEISQEALDYIEKMDSMLLRRHQDDKLNLFKGYDVGALNQIVNTAYIISFLEGNNMVTIEHMKYSWSIFSKTRENTFKIFRDKKAHEEIYELLEMKQNLTQSDLLELDRSDCIPKAKNQFNDAMLLVQELAYKRGKELYIGNGIVTRYTLRDLPKTNLDKLKFSLERDGKMEKAIAFEPVELKWTDIEALSKSYRREVIDEETGEIEVIGTESFTLAHYEPTSKTEPNGHRRQDSFVQGQNVIALDIDGGETIDDIKILLEPYTYCIYTTKSHRKAKRDYKDSFRVILPTKHMYYVNPEQHKEMYSNIAEYLRVDIDLPCRNVSRIWYTNKDAETYINEGDLLDVEAFMPDTEKNQNILPLLIGGTSNSVSPDVEDELERRINGMTRHSIMVITKGNLKNSIYALYSFVMDITGGDRERAEKELWITQKARGYPSKFVEELLANHR